MKIYNLSEYIPEPFTIPAISAEAYFKFEKKTDAIEISIDTEYLMACGMGEKFNSINQKGLICVNEVSEKFCEQGDHTYCSIPFFMLNTGLAVFVDSPEPSQFDFNSVIRIKCAPDTKLVLFEGDYTAILSELYKYQNINISVPPKYAFGPWISANHWKSEEDVRRVMGELDQFGFPATVMVLEAWSDEATFYIFNGAGYMPKAGGEAFNYEDFDFSGSEYWSDPRKLINELNSRGIRLVLWQIPVYKCLEEGMVNPQNELDWEDALENKLCVLEATGDPYRIPSGNWFAGSAIPDFTNPETVRKWFSKRQYLLDIGVSGFKTDGGEFIYRDDIVFHNGTTGRKQKNRYAQEYIDAYRNFVKDDGILFSRAGYIGAAGTPFLWAGDHKSVNDEFKSTYYAAISAACSGILFWGFDIGGFAGELPSKDLYLRATMFACFCPVMQWHSEPDGGQFKDILSSGDGNNERSPWNIAAVYGDTDFIDSIRYWHNLRMNIIPYIYEQAKLSVDTGIPMMRPVFWHNINDMRLLKYEDEYFFGEELLVAPLLEENQSRRELYLPDGIWEGFFSGKEYIGDRIIDSEHEFFPVFIRKGRAINMYTDLEKIRDKDYRMSVII